MKKKCNCPKARKMFNIYSFKIINPVPVSYYQYTFMEIFIFET